MKTEYTINNGLQLAGVGTDNSIIYDNDMVQDTPDLHYLWLKANKGEFKLVGNIATRDMWGGPPNYNDKNPVSKTFALWLKYYDAAVASGLKNIPKPVQGASQWTIKPSSGVIENTAPQRSAGTDLIIAEAKKASPEKPLIVIIGGQGSTLAHAYLLDNSIAKNLIVFHAFGYKSTPTTYNNSDAWAAYIIIKRLKAIIWDGDVHGNYGTRKIPETKPTFPGMPVNAFTNLIVQDWSYVWTVYSNIGDIPPVVYLARHSIFKNVVRKLEGDVTTTADTYDYLTISQNDWGAYWPEIQGYISNPDNYIMGIPPPSVGEVSIKMTNENTEYPTGVEVDVTAEASSPKGIANVKFIHGSNSKIVTSPPYKWPVTIADAGAGAYTFTAIATDNTGATAQDQKTITFKVGAVEPPPVEPPPIEPPPVEPPPVEPPPIVIVGESSFSYKQFGAKGDGHTDDTDAIQAAHNAAAHAKVFAEVGSYVITKPIVVKSEGGQIWQNFEGLGGNTGMITYKGPSNSAVYQILGLKSSKWQGLKISLQGQTGVACLDLTTKAGQVSISDNAFETMRFQLGQGEYNVGVRTGWGEDPHSAGNGADISDLVFRNIRVTGAKTLGQTGWLNVGRNTLNNVWEAGFWNALDYGYSNVYEKGGVKIRGNAGVTFLAPGTSANNCVYFFGFEGGYTVEGGRYELDNQVMKTEAGRHTPVIVFTGVDMSNMQGPVLMELNAAASLVLNGVRSSRRGDKTGFDDLVKVNLSQGSASVIINGGVTLAKNLIRNTGSASVYKSVKGLGKWSVAGNDVPGVNMDGFYPDL